MGVPLAWAKLGLGGYEAMRESQLRGRGGQAGPVGHSLLLEWGVHTTLWCGVGFNPIW